MGKLSIYLPDELEARTKALEPATPTSQVIRAALERYLGADGPAYAEPPDDVDELLAAGVAHFANLARRDYQDGYRAALTRLPDLDWHAITDFARDGFDLYKWLDGWSASIGRAAVNGSHDAVTPTWFVKLADDIGALANPIGFDQWNFRKTAPFERGYADALRAGYEAALRAGVVSGPPAVPASEEHDRDGEVAADV